jgi:DNA-binding MarR family transcriptional regulator
MVTANIGNIRRLACRPAIAHISVMNADRTTRARALHRSRIGALLRLALRNASIEANAVLSGLGLTHPQLEVLAAVAEKPGDDQIGIGATLGMDRSTMAAIALTLEQNGWLIRDAGADRRRKLLTLTGTGQYRLAKGLKAAAEAERAIDPVLLADLTTLADHHAGPTPMPAALRPLPIFLLRRIAQTANAIFAEEGGADAMSGLDYSILIMLAERVADDQATLIEAMSTSRSSSVPALNRLVRQALVTRGATDSDRRRKPLAITRAGRDRLARLKPAVARYEKRLLAPLSDAEVVRLRDALLILSEEIADPI